MFEDSFAQLKVMPKALSDQGEATNVLPRRVHDEAMKNVSNTDPIRLEQAHEFRDISSEACVSCTRKVQLNLY